MVLICLHSRSTSWLIRWSLRNRQTTQHIITTIIYIHTVTDDLRVVHFLPEHIDSIINSTLEIGGMEALSQRFPPAHIH